MPKIAFRWDDSQRQLIIDNWQNTNSFDELAHIINEYIRQRNATSRDVLVPKRSAKAVAIQCVKLSLISKQDLKEWEKTRNKQLGKARSKNLYLTKKEVFIRDNNKCVICNCEDKLEFCHIIPFRDSERNFAQESITLCQYHHRHFDDGCKKCTEKIYARMCQYYDDFKNKYIIKVCDCGSARIIKHEG